MKKWLKSKKWFREFEYWFFKLLLIIPSDMFLSLKYKIKFGVKPNLKNPIGYNEKILWLIVNWYDEKAKICADKYLVRDYVQEKMGG